MPVTFKYVDKKEFDTAVSNTHSGRRPEVFIFAVQEIVFKLGFVDLIRSFGIKIDELTYRTSIALLKCAHSLMQVEEALIDF